MNYFDTAVGNGILYT